MVGGKLNPKNIILLLLLLIILKNTTTGKLFNIFKLYKIFILLRKYLYEI